LNLLGTALTSTAFTINQNSALTLDNSIVNLTDNGTSTFGRIGNSAPITLNSGALSFLAMNNFGVNSSSTETIGAITLSSGQSSITAGVPFGALQAATATSTLTSGSLTRSAGTTLNLLGTNLGSASNRFLFTSAPTTVGNGGGILPYAEVNALSGTG